MKFLIVGLGSMGKRRLRNLSHLKAGELAGFDLRADRREEVAAKFGIPVFDDLERAFSEFAPQALVTSTPPDKHMPIAAMALERGKHVFTEAGTTIDGMARVIALSQQNKLVAAPSCTMRFHPSVKKMKSLIDAGRIGKVLAYTHHCGQYLPDWHPFEDYRTFYVSRRETGACREIVPFELTWLNWLLDSQADLVTAMKGKLSDLECDIDDVYHLLLKYPKGPLCHLLVDVIARAPVRSTRILGQSGTLEWYAGSKTLRHYDAASGQWETHAEPVPVIEEGYSEMSAEGMYIEEMDAYARACRGEQAYPHSFVDDLRILETLYAAEKAADELKQVATK
jgi:predicted dehydrogenase